MSTAEANPAAVVTGRARAGAVADKAMAARTKGRAAADAKTIAGMAGTRSTAARVNRVNPAGAAVAGTAGPVAGAVTAAVAGTIIRRARTTRSIIRAASP